MALTWEAIAEGDVLPELRKKPGVTQLVKYSAGSGDFNPLHMDPDFARSKGFEGAVVHGALLVAKVSQLIGMRLPGRDSVWTGLSLQFRQPLYVGRVARVDAMVDRLSSATGMVVLKVRVLAGDILLAKGEAEVLLVRA